MGLQIYFLIFLSVKLVTCLSEDNTLYFETKEGTVLVDTDLPTFRFASYYGDHMVLQQAPKKSTIWGYASTSDIGQTVNIVLTAEDGAHKSTYQTTVEKGHVNDQAVWSVQLNAHPAGGPYNLTVSVKTATLVLADVLFGDVWLCGGQSNMVFSVPMMAEADVDFEYNMSLKYDKIRLFTAALETSTVPLYDLKGVMEKWSRASPAALGKGQKSFTFFSATCWLYGRHLYESLGYPIGLLESDWGGTPDEAWSSPDALKKCGLEGAQKPVKRMPKPKLMSDDEYQRCCGGPGNNSELWNAMIHPLLNLTITGAIWYQGESDDTKSNYGCTFPAMISDWRSKFHTGTRGQTDALFPFGFVQLAGFNPPAPGNRTADFAPLRWQQTAKYGVVPNPKMPNTFMAVAMDLPDYSSPFGTIHPRKKETVGARLALGGLALAYKFTTKFQGPIPTKMKMGNKIMQFVYDQGKTALSVRNTWGFELCCPAKDPETACDYTKYGAPWQEASIVSHDATSVTISTVNCTSPMQALRYAWRQSPCDYKLCAVYSVDNDLPAPPLYIGKKQLVPDDQSSKSFSITW